MAWIGGAIAAVGSIAGGLFGASSSDKAAKAQQQAIQQGLDWQKQVYGDTQQNLSPYIGAGKSALNPLLGFYGLPGGDSAGATQGFQQFQNTPFYQFPLQQATLGTNRALAASGLIGSGAQLRDLSQLNSGYASQGLGQYLAGLTGIIGSGQNAASSLGGIGAGTGAQIGAGYAGIGNAAAQGIYNGSSSISKGVNNALPFLNNLGQSAYGALYNPVSSLNVYGNTGGAGDPGTSTLQSMGFFNPLGGR